MSKEINLLPWPRRRKLARRFFEREARRFGLSGLLGGLLVTVAGAGALITLTIMSSVMFPDSGDELEAAVRDLRAETRAIQARNERIREMQRQHEERSAWSGYLPDILGSLPAGTQLTEISGRSDGRQITLQGQASARSALIVLENKLKTLPWVKAVVSPPANLLERVSPEFSLTLQL